MFKSDPQIKSFKLAKGKTSWQHIGVILAITLIFIGAIWLASRKRVAAPEVKAPQALKPQENIITPQIIRTADENLQKKLPQDFPENIPLEGKAKIIESYFANYPSSAIKQATVIFESKKTSKENYEFYKKWAEDGGWQIIGFLNQENIKAFFLKKGGEDINITINERVIIISYVFS